MTLEETTKCSRPGPPPNESTVRAVKVFLLKAPYGSWLAARQAATALAGHHWHQADAALLLRLATAAPYHCGVERRTRYWQLVLPVLGVEQAILVYLNQFPNALGHNLHQRLQNYLVGLFPEQAAAINEMIAQRQFVVGPPPEQRRARVLESSHRSL